MRERHEAHVVVVERVGRGAVGERCTRRTRPDVRAQDRRSPFAEGRDHALHGSGGGLARPREHHADGVEKGRRRAMPRVCGRPGVDDELRKCGNSGGHRMESPYD
jgi:hypothetical protein